MAYTQTNEVTNTVEIEMADGGKIVVELDEKSAPITVKNFQKLVSQHFYDGLIFHRVISGFMIQGGDPQGTGMGGSKETIKGEFRINGVANPVSHERGVISMARSQFTIPHRRNFSFAMRTQSFWTDNMRRSAKSSKVWTLWTASQTLRQTETTDRFASKK